MGKRLGSSVVSASNLTNDLIPDFPSTRDIGSEEYPIRAIYADDMNIADDVIFLNPLTGIADNVGTAAAAGTDQASSTKVATTVSRVTAADGIKGVRLPDSTTLPVGFHIEVINSSTTANLKVYTEVAGQQINGIDGTTTAFIVAPNTSVLFRIYNSTNWYSSLASSYGATPIATLAGAGTTQTDAAAIANQKVRVTGANGTVGVKLPALSTVPAGFQFKIINSDVTNALKVYSNAAGELISGQAGTTAISLAAKLVLTVTKYDATNWYAEKSVTPY